MSVDRIEGKSADGEIDLIELFRRIGRAIARGFSALGRAFLYVFFYVMRHWLPLGVSVFAGLVVSYILREASDSYYTTDLVMRTNILSNSDMIDHVNRLHTYSLEGNTYALQNALNIPQPQARNIIDISAFWIIDKGNDGFQDYVDYKENHNVYDTLNVLMKDRFDVRVRIKVPQELSMVRDGLLNYFNTDSLFLQRNRVRMAQNNALLGRYDYDIQQLDSLQKIKYYEETKNRYPQGGGQMIFLQEAKTQLVYSDIYTLYAKRQALELENMLYSGIVTVISDFSIPARRSNGLTYYAKNIVPLFFLLTIVFLVIWENRKRITKLSEKYK